MAESGHPDGWPDHIVDHIKPRKRGGCDCPANMQWQTIATTKAKGQNGVASRDPGHPGSAPAPDRRSQFDLRRRYDLR
jgi:hypothetical protein